MARFGVGQSAPRKEDDALLKGRGRFQDDISLEGEVHACFVRSPHAHAEITAIDVAAAAAADGVLAVYTGADVAADGLGTLPCIADAFVALTRPDGSPACYPPNPMLLGRARAPRGRGGGDGRGRDPGCGGGRGGTGERGVRDPARRGRRRRGPRAGRARDLAGGAGQPFLHVGAWRCRGDRGRLQGRGPRGGDRAGQQPPGREHHRAARRARRLRPARRALHALHQQPARARRARRRRRHSRDRGGAPAHPLPRSRRRLRHEVLHLSRAGPGGLGRAQAGAAGALAVRAQRGLSQRHAGARSPDQGGPGAGRRRAVPGPARAHARQSRRLRLQPRARSRRPCFTRACWRTRIARPRSTRRSRAC